MKKNYSFRSAVASMMLAVAVVFGFQSCGNADNPLESIEEAVEQVVSLIVEKTGATPAEVTAAINEALTTDVVQKAISENQPVQITIKDNTDGDGVESSASDNTIIIPQIDNLKIELIFSQVLEGTDTNPVVVEAEGLTGDEASGDSDNDLTLSMPDAASSKGLTIVIELPNSTVTLVTNGTETVYKKVTAKTATNTLYIEEGVIIEDLVVEGGNVVIDGGEATITSIAEGSKVTIISGKLSIATGVTISELDYQGGTVVDADGRNVLGGTTLYASIAAAVEAGETEVTLFEDYTSDSELSVTSGLTINLNGRKWTVGGSTKVGARITGGNFTINGGDSSNPGTITNGENGSLCYFVYALLGAGDISVSNVKFESSANNNGTSVISVLQGSGTHNFENLTINCPTVQGGIYIGGEQEYDWDNSKWKGIGNTSTATATIKNCTITQTQHSDTYSWTNSALAVSYGSTMTVEGGSYKGAEAAAYVFSSGGTINLKSGTFQGLTKDLKADRRNTGENIPATVESHIYYSSSCTFTGETPSTGGTITSGYTGSVEQKEF